MKTEITWDEFVERLDATGLTLIKTGPHGEVTGVKEVTGVEVVVTPGNVRKWISFLNIDSLSQMTNVVDALKTRYGGIRKTEGSWREVQFNKDNFQKR